MTTTAKPEPKEAALPSAVAPKPERNSIAGSPAGARTAADKTSVSANSLATTSVVATMASTAAGRPPAMRPTMAPASPRSSSCTTPMRAKPTSMVAAIARTAA